MDRKKTAIFRVMVSLNKDGFREKITVYEGYETKLLHIVSSVFDEGPPAKRIKKEQLMRVDSGSSNNHTNIHFMTWCLPEDVERAIKMCKEWVTTYTRVIHKEAMAVFKYLDQ